MVRRGVRGVRPVAVAVAVAVFGFWWSSHHFLIQKNLPRQAASPRQGFALWSSFPFLFILIPPPLFFSGAERLVLSSFLLFFIPADDGYRSTWPPTRHRGN